MTAISVVVPTGASGAALAAVLRSLEEQTMPPECFEVVVVGDGGGPGPSWADDDQHHRVVRQRRCGVAAARRLGLFMARSPVVLFLADDEVAGPHLLTEHLDAHRDGVDAAIVGTSSWSPDLPDTPLLHFLRGVERLPLSYPDEPAELSPHFRHFRARQLSVRRDLLARHAVFDDAFAPLDDVELGYRLHRRGVELRHVPAAASTRVTCPSFDTWTEQTVAEGRAIVHLARAHPDDEMAGTCRIGSALAHWQRHGSEHAAARALVRRSELEVGPGAFSAEPAVARRLWLAYRACFDLDRAAGISDVVASSGR